MLGGNDGSARLLDVLLVSSFWLARLVFPGCDRGLVIME